MVADHLSEGVLKLVRGFGLAGEKQGDSQRACRDLQRYRIQSAGGIQYHGHARDPRDRFLQEP